MTEKKRQLTNEEAIKLTHTLGIGRQNLLENKDPHGDVQEAEVKKLKSEEEMPHTGGNEKPVSSGFMEERTDHLRRKALGTSK